VRAALQDVERPFEQLGCLHVLSLLPMNYRQMGSWDSDIRIVRREHALTKP
jgi:hypothetical protein